MHDCESIIFLHNYILQSFHHVLIKLHRQLLSNFVLRLVIAFLKPKFLSTSQAFPCSNFKPLSHIGTHSRDSVLLQQSLSDTAHNIRSTACTSYIDAQNVFNRLPMC
ncbi:hypothetical protein KAF25_009333 [Fusarium avenaceum]|uniref:Uncharacterized protein n=1 Tax=Fusarium avenaceum TaxID=40199 RepID=A0A9P7HEZ8_9HYPO|nr:hypothetical protein KAF25_009333 [Fusarium avenaceum]